MDAPKLFKITSIEQFSAYLYASVVASLWR